MSVHGSKKVIYVALAGNALIAGSKFTAASLTGSSAMLSEGIHSVVDTGNQLLLLFGISRAARRPDERHPFGYGMELYFWTFVVAILIFAVGAGVSVYEGVSKLSSPHPVNNMMVSYVVLGLSFLFEGYAFSVALREFKAQHTGGKLLDAIRNSKDPTVFTVLFEDGAALLGLIVATLGIGASDILQIPELDGVASILIGLILGATAALLAYECKGLLIGEGAAREVIESIRNIVQEQPGVSKVNELLTMHLGPREVLLNLSLDFVDGISSNEVEASISNMEAHIKSCHSEVTRVFIEAQSWQGHQKDQNTRHVAQDKKDENDG
ncbi:cation diffusion facilitator family transporter [Magnetovibrio blakemorei]|uniref:Cation transporter n=1 Tax=Magnetovibrio blakemorei TaxID=28181 RepID=A0A1E5Q324_9PROT|nr:cation diffusion facilitator family transporter [Magnetovibrio blakemorei]OEJ63813.1 cation transporter [Magnetovibrio blakemorei]